MKNYQYPIAVLGLLMLAGTADAESSLAKALALPAPSTGLVLESKQDGLQVDFTTDAALEGTIGELMKAGNVPMSHVIVMDPATGEVYAFVSGDPERFPATWAYPTASLMKIVTAAATLKHAPEAVERNCYYDGSPYRLAEGDIQAKDHGSHVMSFTRALAFSNNQCFARLAVNEIGEEALVDEMRNLGLFDPPAARHLAGNVKDVNSPLALGYLGSGLGGSNITPLAAARLAAVLAHGKLVRPHWIWRVRRSNGDVLALPGHQQAEEVWPESVVDDLRELLVNVTESGTASRAFRRADGGKLLRQVQVAGKTGTISGSNPVGRYQWFIGVAPADDPKIAIATVVVNDPFDGWSASKLAAQTLREVFCEDEFCGADVAGRFRAHAARRDEEIEGTVHAELVARVHDTNDLDLAPRPLDAVAFDFPRRLLRKPANGKLVVMIQLASSGEVTDAQIQSSDLPDFEDFVVEQVKTWTFTPPRLKGQAVNARAQLPIPIQIK